MSRESKESRRFNWLSANVRLLYKAQKVQQAAAQGRVNGGQNGENGDNTTVKGEPVNGRAEVPQAAPLLPIRVPQSSKLSGNVKVRRKPLIADEMDFRGRLPDNSQEWEGNLSEESSKFSSALPPPNIPVL